MNTSASRSVKPGQWLSGQTSSTTVADLIDAFVGALARSAMVARAASGFFAMPPLFKDCALKSALFIGKYKSKCSVELDPHSGVFLSKTGLPASNGGVILDRPNLRRKLNVFLCVCCVILPIFPYFVSSSHRIIEGRFSISGGVGKQRNHLVRVAIDPGTTILIQPILNVPFRHCLFHPPFWQGQPDTTVADCSVAVCNGTAGPGLGGAVSTTTSTGQNQAVGFPSIPSG